MLDAEVADAPGLDLAVGDRILDRFPALQPFPFAPVRTMQEKEIDVIQSARFDGLFDGVARGLVGRVRRQLRGEPDVLSLQGLRVRGTLQEGPDGLADFFFVAVHLRGIDGAVARFQCPFDGVGGVAAGG